MMGLAEEGTQKECEGENEKPEVNGTREPGDGTSTVSSQSIELEEIVHSADNIHDKVQFGPNSPLDRVNPTPEEV